MKSDKPRNKPMILVVDDDLSLRLSMRAALTKGGFQVEDAENGRVALAAFQTVQPDLVLLDVLMPEMDGFETCKEIRRLPGGEYLPILMVTGLEDVESVHKAFDAGATDFITKPLNWVLLSYRVQYMLRAGHAMLTLRKNQEKLTKTQSFAKLGNWELNLQSRIFDCPDETCQLLGLERMESGMSYDEFFNSVHPSEKDNVKLAVSDALEKEEPFTLNYRVLRPINDEHYISNQGEILYDEEHRSKIMTGIVQDITKIKQAEKEIHKLEFYDGLTELPNRALFLDRLEMALSQARRNNGFVGLLFLDLDRFKRINDTLGHQIGDLLLKNIAKRLRDCIRQTDTITRVNTHEREEDFIARLGGDEFIILLVDLAQPEDSARAARRLQKTISQPMHLHGHKIHITTSLGISIFPADGTDAETLLKNADAARYYAKGEGRDNYQFYKKDLNAASHEKLRLENDFLKGLEQGEFQLYFQPQLNISSRKIVGGEALIRWQHPQMGMIPPDKFIPLAEETGFITKINEWVIQEACRHKRQWIEHGTEDIRIAINVSGFQITRQNIAETIKEALEANGLSCRDLELELTENILIKQGDETIRLLENLKGIGLRISIDDFGTGYSSLSYLTTFPIDTLKIDRSFVMGSTDQPKNVSIIKAIIALGHSLDLKVIAEGVETEEQYTMLRDFGCDEAQGYLFSPPIPAKKFLDVLQENNL